MGYEQYWLLPGTACLYVAAQGGGNPCAASHHANLAGDARLLEGGAGEIWRDFKTPPLYIPSSLLRHLFSSRTSFSYVQHGMLIERARAFPFVPSSLACRTPDDVHSLEIKYAHFPSSLHR